MSDSPALHFEARAGVLKRVAVQWLKSGAGRKYWGEDSWHILPEEERDDAGPPLEWPDDEYTLVYGIKELLVRIKPHAKALYLVGLSSSHHNLTFRAKVSNR